MAGPAPKTKDWSARENVHKPKGLHLIVSGLVQVTSTNKEPRLKESSERDPKHLGLALTIEDTGGPGPDVMCWKAAFFHKEVKANQYDSVTIRWDVSAIAQIPVLDDRECAQKAAAMTAALNAKYAKAPNKAAPKSAPPKQAAAKTAAPKKAKKAAAKKAAPKKGRKKAPPQKTVAARAVRAVGGWAKGVKKALKSVVKSSPKRPAKKAKKKAGRRKAKKR
jgi:hypothetical protein